jgi:hypothetical protein
MLDAILCFIITTYPSTSSLPPTQLSSSSSSSLQPQPSSASQNNTNVIQRPTEHHTTTTTDIRNYINMDDSRGVLVQPAPTHRFQTTWRRVDHNHHHHTTQIMALTFGIGAMLELIAASTTEMEQYPYDYISTYAVVGAAHFYLINAIYAVMIVKDTATVTGATTIAATEGAAETNTDTVSHPDSTNEVKLFGHCTSVLSLLISSSSTIISSSSITYIADRLFLIGSIIDVSLSYFYIGENWDSNPTVWMYIYRGYLFSALLWLLNAMLYIVADCCSAEDRRNVLLVDNDTSTRISNIRLESTTTATTTPSQHPIPSKSQQQQQRFESRYLYSRHPSTDASSIHSNIDPISLLSDHSLALQESTKIPTTNVTV